MAFGLFKKSEKADVIFYNAKVYTMSPDFPEAEAVACADGKIIAVGDYETMDDLISDETNTIDLDGKFMFPGFIDAHSTSVLRAFDGMYFQIDKAWSKEEILEELDTYISENPDADVIIGYGYDEAIFAIDESTEDIAAEDEDSDKDDAFSSTIAELSAVYNEKPVILLSSNCIQCWHNENANNTIAAAAEEELVEIVTVPYIMDLFIPFKFEDVEAAVKRVSQENSDKGYTTVFNICSPDYFDDMYLDSMIGLMNEGSLSQRFYGSLFADRPLNPDTLVYKLMQKKTNCMEMGDVLNYEFLKLNVSYHDFSQSALDTILLAVSDRGFNIHIDVNDEESLAQVYASMETVRSNGYKRNTMVIASDTDIDEDTLNQLPDVETLMRTWGTDFSDSSDIVHTNNVEESIYNMTVKAAELIGEYDHLGTIERGKYADFTIFDENPYDVVPARFHKMYADMTVVAGEVVHDVEEEAMDELYDLISTQRL